MFVSFFIVLITGVIKLPALLITKDFLYSNSVLFQLLHDWGAIVLGAAASIHLILHWKWLKKTTRKMFKRPRFKKIGNILFWVLIISLLIFPIMLYVSPTNNPKNDIIIEGIGTFQYNPNTVDTVRTDLFKPGHFSIFDILVDLDNKNEINMEFHYDADMDTHVIDSINDEGNWWMYAYYDGGWIEQNVFRMDHYPYKPKMFIKMIKISPTRLNHIYDTFKEEILRLNSNNGTLIIPTVTIRGPNNNLVFNDIEVTPHNIRNDTFRNGVITAIDVIMSLGDQGLISYKLNWYESIGGSEVKDFYVDGINDDIAYARCGFVYEAGDLDFPGFSGNHIHIPADIRIITSPEYEEWFWICI